MRFEAQAWLPELSCPQRRLAIEHGLHQEIGWERRTDISGVAVLVFADRIDNPVIEAMEPLCRRRILPQQVLFDPMSGLFALPARSSPAPA
jgi:hypothetical protein